MSVDGGSGGGLFTTKAFYQMARERKNTAVAAAANSTAGKVKLQSNASQMKRHSPSDRHTHKYTGRDTKADTYISQLISAAIIQNAYIVMESS